jgi:hypothetical protein
MDSARALTMTKAFPHITGISVIFDWDSSSRGNSSGPFSQADIVDFYGIKLNEELEYENVRTHYVDTRRPPSRTDADRLKEVPDSFVPLFLSCDWYPRDDRKSNASIVEFCGPEHYKLADALCFALAEWGRCYVFGHRVLRPVAVEGERGFVRVKPFSLNGPHADEYMQRLDKLGEDLGRAIGGFLSVAGQGLRR